MIVINKENGTRGLPYEVGKYIDEKGKERIKSEIFDFLPGNNEISPEIWNKIREGLTDEKKAYYDTILIVVQPITDESGYTIGPDENEIDILELNVNDAMELIAGTASADSSKDIATLEKYQAREKGRDDIKPRKMVLKKIKDQITEIQEHDKKREEEKDKSNTN